MKTSQRILCFQIAEVGVTDFAGLSLATLMCTTQLSYALDDLCSRGFVLRESHLYKLADGVKEALLDKESISA